MKVFKIVKLIGNFSCLNNFLEFEIIQFNVGLCAYEMLSFEGLVTFKFRKTRFCRFCLLSRRIPYFISCFAISHFKSLTVAILLIHKNRILI